MLAESESLPEANEDQQQTSPSSQLAQVDQKEPTEESKPSEKEAKIDPAGAKISDNKYAPTAGAVIDFSTGVAIAPPPGSKFDVNTGTFLMPPSYGTISASGDYTPPEGLELKSDGTFVVAENTDTASEVTNTEVSQPSKKEDEQKSANQKDKAIISKNKDAKGDQKSRSPAQIVASVNIPKLVTSKDFGSENYYAPDDATLSSISDTYEIDYDESSDNEDDTSPESTQANYSDTSQKDENNEETDVTNESTEEDVEVTSEDDDFEESGNEDEGESENETELADSDYMDDNCILCDSIDDVFDSASPTSEEAATHTAVRFNIIINN